ncbi:MAG: hypothetical protein AB7E95_06310 [Kiritimatiellales bacterium]
MKWDIKFGDGTVLRVRGEEFRCASIVAQAQRIAYGETHEQQLAVVEGMPVKPESKILRPVWPKSHLVKEATIARNPRPIDADRAPGAVTRPIWGMDLGDGIDKTVIVLRIPDDGVTWRFDKSEKKELCDVLNDALSSPGPVEVLIRKGDAL